MIEFIRTPEHCFNNILDYNYSPNYVYDLKGADGGRIHYIDEGTADLGVALCLHGNTTWGYCYRKMVKPLVDAGYRVIVPDMIGFGKSDKPLQQNWHNYQRHRTIIKSFIEHLDLNDILLICHDWGGIIGLTIVPEMPERFNKALITNTMIYSGEPMCEDWDKWQSRSNQEDINLTELIQTRSKISVNDDLSAYNAPYPNWRYRAALRAFPNFITKDNFDVGVQALEFWTKQWTGQTFIAIGMQDHIMTSRMLELSRILKHCKEPMMIEEAGHYVTEWGDRIIKKALAAFN